MIAALTGVGLSAAAGLNAFIPLVLVGIFARFTTFIELPENLMWLQEWPTIIIALLLLASELVLDKIPGVDHVNDLIQTAVRPLVGGVIFAASASAAELDAGQFWTDNPMVAGIVGAVIALVVHTGKATSRPAVNASTGGTGAPVASFAEDATSVALSLLAIFAPLLVIVVILGLGVAFYYIITSGQRRRRRREILQAQERLERVAAHERGEKVAWWRASWRDRLERVNEHRSALAPNLRSKTPSLRSKGSRSVKTDASPDAEQHEDKPE
ncbi:MAG: DUF4126 domain-containing protein [Demequina sp.]|nr:DUF4126 domain-containing protein [Demequina sp.]